MIFRWAKLAWLSMLCLLHLRLLLVLVTVETVACSLIVSGMRAAELWTVDSCCHIWLLTLFKFSFALAEKYLLLVVADLDFSFSSLGHAIFDFFKGRVKVESLRCFDRQIYLLGSGWLLGSIHILWGRLLIISLCVPKLILIIWFGNLLRLLLLIGVISWWGRKLIKVLLFISWYRFWAINSIWHLMTHWSAVLSISSLLFSINLRRQLWRKNDAATSICRQQRCKMNVHWMIPS